MTPEEKALLIELLAADYSEGVIRHRFKERKWEPPTGGTLDYYRKLLAAEIDAARAERYETALNRGLATREERVRRLMEHADELELIKWQADKKTGRLHNEKAWRETLAEIAAEMGHRRPGIDDVSEQVATALIERLRGKLDADAFAAVVRALRQPGN